MSDDGAPIKLSPSDFKYLWEQCKHCYYRKAHEGIVQPSTPMPGIFSHMSGMLQRSVQGLSPAELSDDLPQGRFAVQEMYLRSQSLPSGKTFVSGRLDVLAELDDGTHAIMDLKMTNVRDEALEKFDRQLHAYKYALENPQQGDAITISKLGLIIVSPTDVKPHKGHVYYKVKPVWKEIPIDMDKFFAFIAEVEVLLGGTGPKPNRNCDWCKYRHGIL